jgi:recombination endonuclease VII
MPYSKRLQTEEARRANYARVKAWRAANRERRNAWNREWRKRRETEDPEFKVRARAAEKRWRDRNPDKVKAKNDKINAARTSESYRMYNVLKKGLTQDQYNAMLEQQGGGCILCGARSPGKIKKHFCIDHDHKTDRIRGLLCDACNRALGLFKDNPEILRRAAAYVEAHRAPIKKAG